jgi:hypothetical protein
VWKTVENLWIKFGTFSQAEFIQTRPQTSARQFIGFCTRISFRQVIEQLANSILINRAAAPQQATTNKSYIFNLPITWMSVRAILKNIPSSMRGSTAMRS